MSFSRTSTAAGVPFVAPFEITAIAAARVLLCLVRGRRPAFALTFAAAGCLSALLAEFLLVVAPVNAAFVAWTANTLPADWPDYRRQWEVGHAIGFELALTAFGALLRAACADGREQAVGWAAGEAESASVVGA